MVEQSSKDVIYYWHWMQEYHRAQTQTAKRYILEIDMPTFLTEVTNVKVARLLRDYIHKEKVRLGIIIQGTVA